MLRHSHRPHSPNENTRRATPYTWQQSIILSNRGPMSYEHGPDGSVKMRPSAGGLVTALEPLVRACAGTWVACGTPLSRTPSTAAGGFDVRSTTSGYRLRYVCLSQDEHRGYYYGFANEGLWPLCHTVGVQPVFRSSDFLAYRAANARFAAAVADQATCASPLVLVQDYHFALAPRPLRRRLPTSTIVTFWHVPFPPFHVFRGCPWAKDLLDGLLASDIAGFQTAADCANFLTTVELVLGADVQHQDGVVTYRGQTTRVRNYPVGVECDSQVLRETPPVGVCRDRVREELGLTPDARLGVGIDRLDYTKGINGKFLAIERMLECHPEMRGRFTFLQIAEPSRGCLPGYRSARDQLVATAARVNARFGTGTTEPIVLRESHHNPPDVYRLYRAADFCYVGSLRDGMNLVAKEFVSARDDERGVLVLSELAGAALQLRAAVLINPWDVEGSANGLVRALMMSKVEEAKRMRILRSVVAQFDSTWWTQRLVTDACAAGWARRTTDGRVNASQVLTGGSPVGARHLAGSRSHAEGIDIRA